MVDIERVMMKNRRITIATTCEDKKMPLRSLNPILLYSRTNSCVPERRPLGYVEEYAPKAFSGLRLALHHFSNS